jgi:hypothetical protein
MGAVTFELSETDVERIAARVAARIASQQAPAPHTELLDVPAAAKVLKCSVRHLRHLVKLRRIVPVQLTGRGSRLRFTRAEVERVIAGAKR